MATTSSKAININSKWYPLTRNLDGVLFFLALDEQGHPFYTDQQPVKVGL